MDWQVEQGDQQMIVLFERCSGSGLETLARLNGRKCQNSVITPAPLSPNCAPVATLPTFQSNTSLRAPTLLTSHSNSRKMELVSQIFATNLLLDSDHLTNEARVNTKNKRRNLMKICIAHLKSLRGLRGGSPGVGGRDSEVSTGDRNEPNGDITNLEFDIESKHFMEITSKLQENDVSLEFDSESELFMEKEMSKMNSSDSNLDEFEFDDECENLDEGNKEEFLDQADTTASAATGFVKYVPRQKSSCSVSCKDNCENNFEKWSEDKKSEMKELFTKMKKIEKKNFILEHLKKQQAMAFSLSGFFYNGLFFCFKAFEKITGVSDYLVSDCVKAASHGLVTYVHGSQGVEKLSAATIGFIVWMKAFALQYGQYSPDELVIVLPGHLRLVDMLRYYEEDSVQQPQVKPSTFYRLFKEKFSHKRTDKSLPWIRISKYSTHSRCDSCLILDQNRRKAKSLEEISFIKALSYKHMESQNRSRVHIQTLRHKCLSFPAEFVMIQLDDMDNQKSYLPRCVEPGKKLGKLARIPSKITGCIISSGHYSDGRKIKFYINHNQFEQSGSKTVTIIYKLINDFLSDFKVLPRNLIVNCDNCWRENKVRFFLLQRLIFGCFFLVFTASVRSRKPGVFILTIIFSLEQVGPLLLCCPDPAQYLH